MDTPVVVIDPGHGGAAEAGASSPNNTSGGGLLEKHLALDIARRLRDRLSGRARVMLTRDSDSNLSLGQRAGFARAMSADVFVSLHCNGHPDENNDSTEVYIPRVASEKQRALAAGLHRSLVGAIGTTSGGVIEADLGVLLAERHAPDTAAVLVEMFDLTNPQRAANAGEVEFLDKVADAMSDAIDDVLPSAHAASMALPAASPAMRSASLDRVIAALVEQGVVHDEIEEFLDALNGTAAPSAAAASGTLRLPVAHLFEWWQVELVATVLAVSEVIARLGDLRRVAARHGVTIAVGSAAGTAGLVVTSARRVGWYGDPAALESAVRAPVNAIVVAGSAARLNGDPVTLVGDEAAQRLVSEAGQAIGAIGPVDLSGGTADVETLASLAHQQFNPEVATASAIGRAMSVESDVQQVLSHIKSTAARRASVPPSFSGSETFIDVLRSRYLAGYLAAPSAATGRTAMELVGAQNRSGLVTHICTPPVPDIWEARTPAFNDGPIPAWVANIPGMGNVPPDFGAATEILTVANRRALSHIDGPFLLGRRTLDILDCAQRRAAVADPDLAFDNAINASQLMHWATGVRYGDVGHELLRDLFLAYELWHLELWDVFGHDPINDLIVEDAGRHMAGELLAGTITSGNLVATLTDGFRSARQWVGALLAIRASDLDDQVTAMTPPPAHIHWTVQTIHPSDPSHPWHSPSIRRMLTDGSTVDQVKASRLVEDYIAIYTLIEEAANGSPDVSMVQRLLANGSLDGLFRSSSSGAERPESFLSLSVDGPGPTTALSGGPAVVRSSSEGQARSTWAAWKAATSPSSPWTALPRADVGTSFDRLIANPLETKQGPLNLCGPAAFMYLWLQRDPNAAATFACSVYDTGAGMVGSRQINAGGTLSDGPMGTDYSAQVAAHVPAADWMMLSALRNDENAVLPYYGVPYTLYEDPRVSSGTTLEEVRGWLNAAEIYRDVNVDYVGATAAAIDARPPTASRDIVLFINATEFWPNSPMPGLFTDPERWIMSNVPNHFVVLRAPDAHGTYFNRSGGRVNGTVFTYGRPSGKPFDLSEAEFDAAVFSMIWCEL